MEIKASLDRYEGDMAVVYADDGRKFDIPRHMVPASPGSRLVLHLEDEEIVKVELDREGTESARDRIMKKYFRLLRRDR
jgi:hypothetical protein